MVASKKENVKVPVVVEEPLSIKILQNRVSQLNKQIEKLKTGEQIIIDSINRVWAENPPLEMFIPKTPKPDTRKKMREEVAVIHCTDVHYGKTSKTFNSSICEQRLAMLADKIAKITEIRRASARIPHGVVLLGGDMVEGENIFPHQAHSIDCGLLEQACRGGPGAIARFLLSMLEIYETLDVVCVAGNHGRNGPFKNNSHPLTNWDRVLYEQVKTILLGHNVFKRCDLEKRLTFNSPDDFHVIHYVYDWAILLIHGDQMRGGFAGFPYYAIGKKMGAWAAGGLKEPFDYMFMGHYHSDYSGTLNGRKWFCTGSLESDNSWVQENMGAFNPPSQRLCFFDPEEGLISDNTIYLEERAPSWKIYES